MGNIDCLFTVSYLRGLEAWQEPRGTSMCGSEEKARRIVKTLLHDGSLKVDREVKASLYWEVRRALRKIACLRSGRKLLKGLRGAGVSLRNCGVDEVQQRCYRPQENALLLSDRVYGFYIGGRKRDLFEHPFEAFLAHELIHAKHFREDSEETMARGARSERLLDLEFGDQEEQLSICGVASWLPGSKNLPGLCENVFLRAWGLPLRVSHRGLLLSLSVEPPLKSPGLDHMIVAKAYGGMIRTLRQDPSAANRQYHLSWVNRTTCSPSRASLLANKIIRPLILARILGDEKAQALLLRFGAFEGMKSSL